MSDRDQIIDVLVRYATGIDSRDWTLFRTCFADDAHFDYGGIGKFGDPDSLTAFMRRNHAGPSMHRLTNFAVTITGDHARARTYVDGFTTGPRGLGMIENYGWYDDELVRTSDGWRIRFRQFTVHGARLPGPLRLIPPAVAGRVAGMLGSYAKKSTG